MGRFLSAMLMAGVVAGSFYLFGQVEAQPSARLSLLAPAGIDSAVTGFD